MYGKVGIGWRAIFVILGASCTKRKILYLAVHFYEIYAGAINALLYTRFYGPIRIASCKDRTRRSERIYRGMASIAYENLKPSLVWGLRQISPKDTVTPDPKNQADRCTVRDSAGSSVYIQLQLGRCVISVSFIVVTLSYSIWAIPRATSILSDANPFIVHCSNQAHQFNS